MLLQLKNDFIHFYIETFLPHDKFFDILLIFFFFRHITIFIFSKFSFFYVFLLQISFCIYLLLVLLISLHQFHNDLQLYLVSCLNFFDNRLNRHFHPFLYIIKKNYKPPLSSTKLEPLIILIASSLLAFIIILAFSYVALRLMSFRHVPCLQLTFYVLNSYKVSSRKTCG